MIHEDPDPDDGEGWYVRNSATQQRLLPSTVPFLSRWRQHLNPFFPTNPHYDILKDSLRDEEGEEDSFLCIVTNGSLLLRGSKLKMDLLTGLPFGYINFFLWLSRQPDEGRAEKKNE